MKKVGRIVLILTLVGLFGFTLYYLFLKSQAEPVSYETAQPTYSTIIKKSVATGSIVPREEVGIKPQVSGIVQELFVEAGERVKAGDLLARIQVIPNMVNLNNAENRVKLAEIGFQNAELDYQRNDKLYKQGAIAQSEFQVFQQAYKSAQAELEAARDNLQIVREGASKKAGKSSLNLVRATVSGMVLDVPVKVGYQVIESNTFNEGTTIATIANMNDMIFQGKIDEGEVGKISPNLPLLITVGAIEGETFDATLEYVAPKGVTENGAIQFEIRAQVALDSAQFLRAGYSANADIVLARRDSVLSIPEALLQFNEDQTPFVEVETGPQIFEKRAVKLGLSNGLTVEILDGLTAEDRVKIWNRAQGF